MFSAGELYPVRELVFLVGFFFEFEGTWTDSMELFGYPVVWKGEAQVFPRKGAGERIHERDKV